MSFFIFNGGRVTDEEVALATPDLSEAKSLSRHVERCALRYKLFTKRQAAQGDELGQIKLILLLVGSYLVLVSEPARNTLGFVFKIFAS